MTAIMESCRTSAFSGNGRCQDAVNLTRSVQVGTVNGISVRSPSFRFFTCDPAATTRPTPSIPSVAGGLGR